MNIINKVNDEYLGWFMLNNYIKLKEMAMLIGVSKDQVQKWLACESEITLKDKKLIYNGICKYCRGEY